jgi:hypothetical protein
MISDVIEPASAPRSQCRRCRKSICEGELRFGLVQTHYDSRGSLAWFHLPCATRTSPGRLLTTLQTDHARTLVQNWEALIEACDQHRKKKVSKYPYGERAPTGRSKCMACDLGIARGALRISMSREISSGEFSTIPSGYLHLACAPWPRGDVRLELLRANSTHLPEVDLIELMEGCGI